MADRYDSLDFDDDDYDEPGRRSFGRRLLTASIAVVALGGFAAVIAMVYGDAESVNTARVPTIIKSVQGPHKVKPDSPGGMKIPHRDKSVYKNLLTRREGDKSPLERLRPPPEKPLNAPSPDSTTARAGDASSVPDAPAIAPPEEPPVDSATAALRPRTRGDDAKTALIAEEEGDKKADSPAGRKSYRVQLASLRSNGAVQRAWSRLQQAYPDLLGPLGMSVVRKDLGSRGGVFYRMQVGPLSSADAARTLCGQLKERRQDCIIVPE